MTSYIIGMAESLTIYILKYKTLHTLSIIHANTIIHITSTVIMLIKSMVQFSARNSTLRIYGQI